MQIQKGGEKMVEMILDIVQIVLDIIIIAEVVKMRRQG